MSKDNADALFAPEIKPSESTTVTYEYLVEVVEKVNSNVVLVASVEIVGAASVPPHPEVTTVPPLLMNSVAAPLAVAVAVVYEAVVVTALESAAEPVPVKVIVEAAVA